jgi:hypothetical protein
MKKTLHISVQKLCNAWHQWSTPVILAPQEAEIRRVTVRSQPRLQDPLSKIPITKIGLVEWLKVKALSSSPSTAKKERKKERKRNSVILIKYFQYIKLCSWKFAQLTGR